MDEIWAPIRAEIDLLEEKLESIFSIGIDLISAIGQHLVAAKGKRVRPILVFLSAKLGDPDTDAAVKVGAAVEVIHTATLLHDDSLDRSGLRRGLPTVNRLWNDQVSVIMGDYLFCTAFKLLHEAGLFDVASVISEGSNRVTFGEMFQMDLRGKYDISEKAYLDMIRNKTAALFSCACEAGAILGGLGDTDRASLVRYGESLGVAFQIVDDVFDVVGDADLMGKPVGSDLRDGRITLPVIAALKNAAPAVAGRIRDIVSSGSLDDPEWDELVGLIDGNGGIDYARSMAARHAREAKSWIEGIRACPAKTSLLSLADLVVSRNR
jgi:octaprenyl-diphosphate synthase